MTGCNCPPDDTLLLERFDTPRACGRCRLRQRLRVTVGAERNDAGGAQYFRCIAIGQRELDLVAIRAMDEESHSVGAWMLAD